MSISAVAYKKAPRTPGVYRFQQGKTILYIGKARNLFQRLSSYFRNNVSTKTRQMVQEATSLDWIETSSEIEALIHEAELIKTHLPKFNVLMRDDRNYLCRDYKRGISKNLSYPSAAARPYRQDHVEKKSGG